jgi:hypothetical protein
MILQHGGLWTTFYLCSVLCYLPVEATLKHILPMFEYISVFVHFIYFCEKLN